jgi:hypothetical protein
MASHLGTLAYDDLLGRLIRIDDIDLLGTSTFELFDLSVAEGAFDHASALAQYSWDECDRIGQALYTWIDDIAAFEARDAAPIWPHSVGLMRGVRTFNPGEGDLVAALEACRRQHPAAAQAALERMRVRWCAVHDWLVVWIQELLTSLVAARGEEAVLESVRHAYEAIWGPRYATWYDMQPIQRLRLSVEGMRGHLSGSTRRGDLIVLEEPDRFVMVLDPCGSCGILRRGDPESGRPPYSVAGNARPHPWTWGRVGVGWYAVHSPIALEFVHYERGAPPLRPLEGCDGNGPCRWYVYKDVAAIPSTFAERMGFDATP